MNPMIPVPGETPAAWWTNTGAVQAREARAARLGYPVEFDPRTYMFHDVPVAVLATVTPKGDQSQRPFGDTATFTGWSGPTTVIRGEDDRYFPIEFQQHLARERLGVEPIVVPGGHLVALSRPVELTAAIPNATSSEWAEPAAVPPASPACCTPSSDLVGCGNPFWVGVSPLNLSSGRHRPAHTLGPGRTAARATSRGWCLTGWRLRP